MARPSNDGWWVSVLTSMVEESLRTVFFIQFTYTREWRCADSHNKKATIDRTEQCWLSKYLTILTALSELFAVKSANCCTNFSRLWILIVRERFLENNKRGRNNWKETSCQWNKEERKAMFLEFHANNMTTTCISVCVFTGEINWK